MITKITCRYSFEVLDFHCNDFGFTFNIGVSYLGIYKTSMVSTRSMIVSNDRIQRSIRVFDFVFTRIQSFYVWRLICGKLARIIKQLNSSITHDG